MEPLIYAMLFDRSEWATCGRLLLTPVSAAPDRAVNPAPARLRRRMAGALRRTADRLERRRPALTPAGPTPRDARTRAL